MISGKKITLLITFVLTIIFLIGCEKNYDLKQFERQMKAKNYNYKLTDVSKDFLDGKRVLMTIDNEHLNIYSYPSLQKAHSDAGKIDADGSGYSSSKRSVKVSWTSTPHFFKKGNIIVLYVGTNEKIISDLTDILGKQFAGHK